MEYSKLTKMAREELAYLCKYDKYGLRPESLFDRIKNSKGDCKTLAEIFEISLDIVKEIRGEDKWI